MPGESLISCPTMDLPWADQTVRDRMTSAVERVRQRLDRATAALVSAGVPHAVIGANAVAAWVSTVDEGAVRNTPNVDILIRRDDIDAAGRSLTAAGFVRQQTAESLIFLDGPDGRPRGAVRLVIAGEPFRATDILPTPGLEEAIDLGGHRVVGLASLIRMKLTANRLIDRVHLRDMLDVGLIDPGWLAPLPDDLAARLQALIDTPEG